MRNAARTDANQAEIVRALRAIGCQVYYIKLPVDLMVSGGPLRNRTMLLEVKLAGERLTGSQENFFSRWPGEWAVVHSPAEAVNIVCGKELLA